MDELIQKIESDCSDYSAVALLAELERRKLAGDYTVGDKTYSPAIIEQAFEYAIRKKHGNEDADYERRRNEE